MAGRGGRGAALLQALGAPARPPGQAAATQNGRQNGHVSPPVGQPVQGQQQQQQQQPSQTHPYHQTPHLQQAPFQQVHHPHQAPPKQQHQYPTSSQQRYPTPSQLQGSGRGYHSQTGYQGGQSQQQIPAAYGRGSAVKQLPYGRGAHPQVASQGAASVSVPQTQGVQGVTTAPQRQQQVSYGHQRTPSPPQAQPAPSSQPPVERMAKLQLENIQKTQTAEKGSSGKPVMLSANYIPIHSPSMGVFQYHVNFSPEIDSRSMRYGLLIKQHADVLGETKQFDGSSLYLPFKLSSPTTTFESTRPTDGQKITINIILTRVVPPEECIHFYNVIFRRVMKVLEMDQVGRYYYNPKRPAMIPQHKLELWPGYITAIHHYEGGLMLLADVSHKLLRTETVLNFMFDRYNVRKERFQEEITRQLVGTIVLTRYNNKTYRVDDIEWGKNPLSTFPTHSGEEITYVDYYKKTYNKEIRDMQQPLLVHKPKKTQSKLQQILLIPEFCCMTGLTDNMRQDFKVMKDIAIHTRVTPNRRQEAMRGFIENVNSSPKALKELSSWGLKLDMSLLKVQGRQLQSEKILFGKTSVTANAQADFGRDAVKEQVITPVHLNSWVVVFVRRDKGKALDFVSMLKKVTPSMGISVADPVTVELHDDRTESYLRSIRESLHPQVQVVVIIFPTSRDDRYAAVKKLCCVESPVPSQVINSRTISQQNKMRSVTQKIALQINVKLGGELWALNIPSSTLMVVGIDVYHDAARGGRSVGGFVASTNKSLTRWYSRVCFQSPGQELIDGLKMCLTASLKKYHEMNHALPERIIVYRDGVGDGQLNTVAGYEVQQLSECFGLFGEKYEPKMAVVVVQKRINTRIFSVMGNGPSPDLDNPGPGTVLDHTVTRKDWYDFYLVSQHVRQGTVTPTHYVVVHDKSGWKPDHMQKLSYKLTHLYYNWPGTVRVPAPCQYAHKLAFQVGQCIHREPSHDLSDRLFFL